MASFGMVAKKIVIGRGEPSYTSGLHICKGTAAISNSKLHSRHVHPTKSVAGRSLWFSHKLDSVFVISSKLVEPVIP